MYAVLSLGQIGAGNPAAINAFTSLLSQTQSEKVVLYAVASLRQIGADNTATVNALKPLIENFQNEEIVLQAAISLLKIDPDNPKFIEALKSIIQKFQDRSSLRRLAQIIWLEKTDLNSNIKVTNEVIEALVRLVQQGQFILEGKIVCRCHGQEIVQLWLENHSQTFEQD